ncbi:MAG: OmpA family protein [Acidimicrobiia bacterium]
MRSGKLLAYDTDLVTFPVTKTRASIHRDQATGAVQVTLPGDVLFAIDSAELSPDATTALGDALNAIRQARAASIVVDGHTDNTGDDDRNQALSLERAQTVANWLVAHGVPQPLVSAHGWGSSRPIASNDDPAGRQRNRRAEITIVAHSRA